MLELNKAFIWRNSYYIGAIGYPIDESKAAELFKTERRITLAKADIDGIEEKEGFVWNGETFVKKAYCVIFWKHDSFYIDETYDNMKKLLSAKGEE